MDESHLQIRRRNLSHWELAGSVYFVTFRTAQGELLPSERGIVMAHVLEGMGRFYELPAAVIMPDHVHILVRPLAPYDLPRVMKGIKGVSARKINEARSRTGQVWQDESWDRLMRDGEEFEEKLQYMADNPVKAGLARRLEDYP